MKVPIRRCISDACLAEWPPRSARCDAAPSHSATAHSREMSDAGVAMATLFCMAYSMSVGWPAGPIRLARNSRHLWDEHDRSKDPMRTLIGLLERVQAACPLKAVHLRSQAVACRSIARSSRSLVLRNAGASMFGKPSMPLRPPPRARSLHNRWTVSVEGRSNDVPVWPRHSLLGEIVSGPYHACQLNNCVEAGQTSPRTASEPSGGCWSIMHLGQSHPHGSPKPERCSASLRDSITGVSASRSSLTEV